MGNRVVAAPHEQSAGCVETFRALHESSDRSPPYGDSAGAEGSPGDSIVFSQRRTNVRMSQRPAAGRAPRVDPSSQPSAVDGLRRGDPGDMLAACNDFRWFGPDEVA